MERKGVAGSHHCVPQAVELALLRLHPLVRFPDDGVPQPLVRFSHGPGRPDE